MPSTEGATVCAGRACPRCVDSGEQEGRCKLAARNFTSTTHSLNQVEVLANNMLTALYARLESRWPRIQNKKAQDRPRNQIRCTPV